MEHEDWPALPLLDWEPTYLTLHRWTQIAGKVQLALAAPLNHWWHVAQHVTSRGLSSGSPCGRRHLTMTFDFCAHRFVAETGDKCVEAFDLAPMTVAAFYERVLEVLAKLDVHVHVRPVPVEVRDTTAFPDDRHHGAYDRTRVEAFHRVLLSVDRVFNLHRGRFLGKSSPVNFFWGAFDLAVTRFSGRRNPNPPAGAVMHEAYSHEVISHGFWPGGDWLDRGRVDEAVFYAYAVPEPPDFRTARVSPPGATYAERLGEILLPYATVRTSPDPEATLLDFMESTYLAAARAAGWDVEGLRAPAAEKETGTAGGAVFSSTP
jgi:hypothetical protein